MRSSEEIRKEIQYIRSGPNPQFREAAIRTLTWALDKTEREIRIKYFDIIGAVTKLEKDKDNQHKSVPKLRYELETFRWLRGENHIRGFSTDVWGGP